MAFGGFRDASSATPMAEINMVPLIDVMLVLLVIFIITAPLLTHAVKIDLPRAASQPAGAEPATVQLGVLADGKVVWNGEGVDRGALEQHMAAAARLEPQPELQLRADRTARYEAVAEVLSAAARAGLLRIAFVTDPATAQ